MKYQKWILLKIFKILYIINKKKYNSYIFSYFNDLKSNYEKVIEKFKYYSRIKNDVLNFMQICYKQIIEIYNIVKLKMKDDILSKFEVLNFEEIKKSINKEYQEVSDYLEEKYKEKQIIINQNISKCKENENSFNKLVNDNKGILDHLIRSIEKRFNRFDSFLRKNNPKVIDNLNLKESEEDKKNFEKNMSQFEKAKMENISEKPNEFIMQKKFLFIWKVFDYKETFKKNQIIKIKYYQ